MSPSANDASVHRQPGELAEGLRGVQQSLQRMGQNSRRSQDKSAESRPVVHWRMDVPRRSPRDGDVRDERGRFRNETGH